MKNVDVSGFKKYTLYDGEVELRFDPEKHKYYYRGEVIQNVTDIVGVLDKSDALIGWAVGRVGKYLERELYPGRLIDEVESKKLIKGIWGFRRAFTDAGDIGTISHKWIEQYINSVIADKEPPRLPVNPEIKSVVESFLNWEKTVEIEYLEIERKIFSLSDEFAGTLDTVAMVNNLPTIIDFKTSNDVRESFYLQTAAYADAYNEEKFHNVDLLGVRPKPVPFDNRLILVLSKKGEEAKEHWRLSDQYVEDYEGFKNALGLYRWNKRNRVPRKRAV